MTYKNEIINDLFNDKSILFLIVVILALILTLILLYYINYHPLKSNKTTFFTKLLGQKSKSNKKSYKNKLQKGGSINNNITGINEILIYLFIGLLGISIVGYLIYDNYQLQKEQRQDLKKQIDDVNKKLNELTIRENKIKVENNNNSVGIPINQRSRGEPLPYRPLGYLYNSIEDDNKTEDTTTQDNNISISTATNTININNNINTGESGQHLQLYGREIYQGSTKWNYYTFINQFNQIRVPLIINGKDSMQEYGVDELYEGDIVTLSNGKTYTVYLYEKETPRYIPY